jgi:AMP deaminase
MDSYYAIHLAMAALVGASLAAASAYYMHRKTLNQLLDFARDRSSNHVPPRQRRRKQRSKRAGSMSLPDIAAVADVDGEEEENEEEEEEVEWGRGPIGQVANGGLAIPPGLPRLHVSREGIDYCHYGSPQFFSDFSPE